MAYTGQRSYSLGAVEAEQAYTAQRSYSLGAVETQAQLTEKFKFLKTCLSTGNSRRCSKVRLAPPLPMLLNDVDEAVPFVTLLMNGNCVVRSPFPEGTGSVMEVETDVPGTLRINSDGMSLYLHMVACTASTLDMDVHVSIRLIDETTDAEEEVHVGTLGKDVEKCSSVDFVPFVPTRAVLVLSSVPEDRNDLVEKKFVASLVEVLRSPALNPGQGSMSAAVLQNHAKCLPLYKDIVEKAYGGCWLQFLKQHEEVMDVLQLSEAEINTMELCPLVKVGEPRVVLCGTDWKTLDAKRARQHRDREQALLKHLIDMFSSSNECLTQQELMEILCDDEDFLFFVQPSLAAVGRFIMQHKDTFAWPTHPSISCTTGLRRGRSGEVPLTKNTSERIPINAARKGKPGK
eukprot:TRINITY_DN26769_c0_g1_i1.p1 TRINITY_DN26769_c0_g1~~TRINITY_DN26769_c0_g1_i1.p1  ORF type:complete len:415 (+),score=138.73 TRINITY_DN26769_c0_g1_i1:38-1246(+)